PRVFWDGGAGETNGAGWRHLSVPVPGITVADLASQNLVQGIPGQYPGFAPNLYVTYQGGPLNNGFLPPAATSHEFESGRGFFWYLYDVDLDPDNPTGTSNSVSL